MKNVLAVQEATYIGLRMNTIGNVLAAMVTLFVGALVYFFDRPLVMPTQHHQWQGGFVLFGAAGANLPSFCHAYAFSLLTACTLPLGRYTHYTACAIWLVLSCLFELGQMKNIAEVLDRVGTSFIRSEAIDWFVRYFRQGTFDVWDIAAATLGVAVAFVQLTHLLPVRLDYGGASGRIRWGRDHVVAPPIGR